MGLIVDTPFGKAFKMNDERVNRFFERIARAIVNDALSVTYFPARLEWHFQEKGFGIYNKPPKNWIAKRVGNVFRYAVAPTDKGKIFGLMFSIYDGLFIGCDLIRI